MRNRRSVLAAPALLLLGGCALLLDGTSQEVTFHSDPEGATVRVAGQTARTPVTLDLPKGEHDVVFEKAGYEPSKHHLTTSTSTYFYFDFLFSIAFVGVDLATGAWRTFDTRELRPVLRPLPEVPEIRRVRLTSRPSEAEVVVDGAVRGRTPLELDLSWGSKEEEKAILFRAPGYRDATMPLARGLESLHCPLPPIPVRVRAAIRSTPSGADVIVDGRLVGRTPMTLEIDWLPGEPDRVLEVTAPGYEAAKRGLGKDAVEVHVELRERIEEIELPVDVTPPGSWVQVDGAPARPAGKSHPLPWSISKTSHTLVFSHPGYGSKTVMVDSKSARTPLSVRLAPLLQLDR